MEKQKEGENQIVSIFSQKLRTERVAEKQIIFKERTKNFKLVLKTNNLNKSEVDTEGRKRCIMQSS